MLTYSIKKAKKLTARCARTHKTAVVRYWITAVEICVIGCRLEQIAVPKHFEKIEDIHNLDLSDTARDSVARDDYASAIRKLFAIFFEVTHVLTLHLIG